MSDHLIERNGYYYYFRRVPRHIAPYDSRRYIKISLKTKDRGLARKRALVHNETIEKFWRDIATTPNGLAEQDERYKLAVQSARMHGFTYRDISDLSANAGLGEVVDRMLALKEARQQGRETDTVLRALTGTAPSPTILLSQTFGMFRPRCADRLAGKTPHQIRKWENPRRLAVDNFIGVVGDKPITALTRKDILAFQEWWLERISQDRLKADSANKNLSHLKDILDTVFIAADIEPPLDIDTLFAKVKLRGGNNSRKSYEAKYVQDVFLKGDALKGLNTESRALIYFMADTGARVAEITGLLPEDISLESAIPFIHIRSNARRSLKTPHSDRQIPLVGAALYAARQFPQGLSRYSSADSASTQVNKYLRTALIPPASSRSTPCGTRSRIVCATPRRPKSLSTTSWATRPAARNTVGGTSWGLSISGLKRSPSRYPRGAHCTSTELAEPI